MTRAAADTSVRWYQSFYFRLGFSFVVYVVSLLIAQSAIFNMMQPAYALMKNGVIGSNRTSPLDSEVRRSAAQKVQEIEFLFGELDRCPSHRRLPLVGVHQQVAANDLTGGASAAIDPVAPPQQRRDASHQLAHAERLGEVVISAILEAEYLV